MLATIKKPRVPVDPNANGLVKTLSWLRDNL
jgi:hypothetical protein